MFTLKQAAPYLVEFLGTFFVAFSGGCVDATGTPNFKPTSSGFAVVASMYAFGSVSAHMSPAISISFGLTGQMAWSKVWAYVVLQLTAAMLAALLATHLLHHSFDLGPHGGHDMGDSLVVEVIYSATLCFVALNVMASRRVNPPERQNQFFALAVGFVYIASGHVAREVCGAWLNPAMNFGFGVVLSPEPYACIVYLAYQAAGAVLAAMLFFMVRPEELGTSTPQVSQAWRALSLCGSRNESPSDGLEGQQESNVHYEAPWPCKVLGEFLGTYVIAVTFALARVLAVKDEQDAAASSLDDYTVIWATGAVWLSMAYSLGDLSAHFNPAVTVAAVLRGGCSVALGFSFLLAQGCAGVGAGLTCLLIRKGGNFLENPWRVNDLGPKELGWPALAVGEVLFTMAICVAFLCVNTVKSERYPKAPSVTGFEFGLASAFAFSAGGIALHGLGCLNPALALGVTTMNFVSSGFVVGSRATMLMQLCLLELLGAAAAALMFVQSHPKEYTKDPLLVN